MSLYTLFVEPWQVVTVKYGQLTHCALPGQLRSQVVRKWLVRLVKALARRLALVPNRFHLQDFIPATMRY